MRRSLAVLALFASLALSLAACGSPPTQDVKVTLSDFTITSSVTTFTTGVRYHFVVTNAGQVVHDMRIAPPMTPGTQMGQGQIGTSTMLAMTRSHPDQAMAPRHGGELVIVANVAPGETKTAQYTFTVTRPMGGLEMGCHVAGHYESGMKIPIAVK